MGSPIETWEGAEAVFTGAHSSTSIWFFLILAVVLCILPIINAAMHENHAYREHED